MPRRGLWINPTISARHLSDQDEKRIQIYNTLDRGGFDWQVFFVAASGFFTDSYNLFATNIILPSIAYCYWAGREDDQKQKWELAINIATLGGSAVGQLLFGYLADRYGRRKLYGLELIIVIVSTLGLTQASTGYFNMDNSANPPIVYTSMNIQAWLIFYRLLQGIGIGAEYPMSAVITAEFASARSRGRMMASVFLAQPLATMMAAIVGLAVVVGYSSNEPGSFGPNLGTEPLPDATVKVDKIWRWVIGVGAIPAFIAILFRLTIPESPRYTLDVDLDASRALQDALHHYGSMTTINTQHTVANSLGPTPTNHTHHTHHATPAIALGELTPPQRSSIDDLSPMASPDGSVMDENELQPTVPPEPRFFVQLYQYLRTDGNWRWLAGTSICWFILDFAYYGLGISNPRTLAKIWANAPQPSDNDTYRNSWDTGLTNNTASLFSNDGGNIFYVLRNDAIRSIITTSIGAIVGGILLIQVIPYVPRKALLTWSFVVLSILLIVTGGSLFAVFETDQHAVTITLYVLIQLVYNVGPNTLLFIYPAEIFPTKFRGTCYGIASASGKISAVIVQAILPYARFGSHQNGHVNDQVPLAGILIIWGALMLLGAFFSWLWLPEVQKPRARGDEPGYRIPNKTLEELAEGRGGATQQNENFASKRRRWGRNKEMNGAGNA